jgi:hypothetical protein
MMQVLPVDPFVVIEVEIVCVTEIVNLSPFVRPALLTLRVSNVFAPLTVMLSPENVTTLKVFPPPANVFVEEDVSLTMIVDVFALKVGADVAKSQTVPVPVHVQVVDPSVSVLVPDAVTYFPVLGLKPFELNVPAVCVNVAVTALVIAEFNR